MRENEFDKDPDAILDYTIDWSEWLGTDTIATSNWTVDSGIVNVSDSINTELNATTIWLSGGTSGEIYYCENAITTIGGRTDHRTITINVVEK